MGGGLRLRSMDVFRIINIVTHVTENTVQFNISNNGVVGVFSKTAAPSTYSDAPVSATSTGDL